MTSLVTTAQLTVSQLNYTPTAATTTTALPTGSPIGYVVTPGVTGLAEVGTISVTETVPAGHHPAEPRRAPVGSAARPSASSSHARMPTGRSLSGGTLTTVTVSAVVTGAAVTQTTMQAQLGGDRVLGHRAGRRTRRPAPPTRTRRRRVITALSPVAGLVAGGNSTDHLRPRISRRRRPSRSAPPQSSTREPSSTLLRCASVAAPGCFTVSGSTLVISSMPAHAVATMTVEVVNLGAAGTATYNYMTVPTTPVVTAANAGARKGHRELDRVEWRVRDHRLHGDPGPRWRRPDPP